MIVAAFAQVVLLAAASSIFPNAGLAIGTSPGPFVVFDFNGDGRLDLAVSNATRDVSIRFARADGTFSPEVRADVPGSAGALAAGDFNWDGRGDLAVADPADGLVFILIGNGASFAPPVVLRVGEEPESIVVADFNGDGRQDLAVGNGTHKGTGQNDGLSILLGRGDGTFLPERRIPAPGTADALVAADFNGDGRIDLAFAQHDSPADVAVMLGDGTGGFVLVALPNVDLGDNMSIAIGDFNGDGRLDIIAGEGGGATNIVVFPGRGDGTFGAGIVTQSTCRSPGSIAVADFNRDGRLDAAFACGFAGHVSVRFGNGDGTFGSERLWAAGSALAIAVANLNGDAAPDLVVLSGPRDLYPMINNGDGTFDQGRRVPSASGPVGVSIADVNNDGRPDLTVLHRVSADVTVQLGDGHGGFSAAAHYPLGGTPRALDVADVNEDGARDIVVANYGADRVSVLFGADDGSFVVGPTLTGSSAPTGVAVADVNGDGHPDVIASNEGDHSLSLWLGRGGGAFADAIRIDVVGSRPQAVAAGDLNGDGLADVVVATSTQLTLLLGRSTAPFLVPVGALNQDRNTGVVLTDLDRDGALDVVAITQATLNEVRVNFGNGDGTFLPAARYEVGLDLPDAVEAADVSGDGLPDLVVMGHTKGFADADLTGIVMAVRLATGVRALGPEERFRAGIGVPRVFNQTDSFQAVPGPSAFAIGDLTGDGLADLVVTNYGDDDVSILQNQGIATVAPTLTLAAIGSGTGSVVSSPPGIACGGDCSARFAGNTVVTLMPTPSANSVFAGFTGDPGCVGTFVANVDLNCYAVFNLATPPPPRTRLVVYKRGFWFFGDAIAFFGDDAFGNGPGPARRPVRGDWTGTGRSHIGLFDTTNGNWLLDLNGNMVADGCAQDGCYHFGGPNFSTTPIVGDWTGDGRDKIGTFSTGFQQDPTLRLDLNGNGVFDGCAIDKCIIWNGGAPVAGDWTGAGIDRLGGYRSDGTWWLDLNGNFAFDGCAVDLCATFGAGGETPVVGDWDGSGRDKIGLYRSGLWVLDLNGNFQFDGCSIDLCVFTGDVGALPVPGKY